MIRMDKATGQKRVKIIHCYSFQKRRVHLTPEQASDFYAEHYGKLFFASLVAYMSSGPIIALVISRDQAISYWRELIGPTNTIKARQTHPDWYGNYSFLFLFGF